MLPMMARPILLGAAAWLLLGCGSIDEEEVEEAARATRRTVERGVEGAREGIESTWDAAVDAYEERRKRKEQEERAQAASPPVDLLKGAAEAIACEAPGERCTVASDYVAAARQHPSELAKQVRARPVSSPVAGIRIDGITTGSIAEQVGMQTGDVVTHVNGIAVGSMQDAMLLYMNLRAARSFVVDYRRGEQEHTLQVDVV